MTNPTLIAQDNAWRGFTADQLVEQLLQKRGLTNDAATHPTLTLASSTELLQAQTAVRRAYDLLNVEFAHIWAIQVYTVTWTAGDHTIALPKNVLSIKAVTYRGLSLKPLSDDDYYRLLQSDADGGDTGPAGQSAYYRVVGVADADAGTAEGNRDWRLCMRLHPEPGDGYDDGSLVVEYVTLAEDLEHVDATEGGDPIKLWPHLQGWVLERAGEIWFSGAPGDMNRMKLAETERLKHEKAFAPWMERATRQAPQRMTWRHPNVRRSTRYRS